MVGKPVSKKIVMLLLVSISAGSLLFLAASGLSLITSDMREHTINSIFNNIEENVFALETTPLGDDLNTIYSILSKIESLNSRLREFYSAKLISPEFYYQKEDGLVTLSTLVLKTIRLKFENVTIVHFFCEDKNSACEYEEFVLSYLSNKFRGRFFIMGFDIDSYHPLVRMLVSKYAISAVPFIVINDVVYSTFLNARELEAILVNDSSNISITA